MRDNKGLFPNFNNDFIRSEKRRRKLNLYQTKEANQKVP
jgi:hypothetical protein